MAELAAKDFTLSDEVKQFYFDIMAGDNMDIGSVRLKPGDAAQAQAFSEYIDMLCDDNEALVDFLNSEYTVFRNFMDSDMPEEQSFEYREMENRFLSVSSWITGPNNYNPIQSFEQILNRSTSGPVTGLTTEAMDFYFDRMVENGMDLNGLKLQANNDGQRSAFYNYVNDVCARTPAIASLMLDAFAKLKTYEKGFERVGKIDEEAPRYVQLQELADAATEELEAIAEFEKVDLQAFAPEGVSVAPKLPKLDLAPFAVPAAEELPAEVEAELEAGLAEALAAGLAASEMSAEEIAELEARALAAGDDYELPDDDKITFDALIEADELAAQEAAEAAADAKVSPIVLRASRVIEVPEGGFRAVGPAIEPQPYREPEAYDGGETIEGTLAEEEEISAAPSRTKFIWEFSDEELAEGGKEENRDELIKKAIADWYLCVGKQTDLDQDSIDIAFNSLMKQHSYEAILLDIKNDVQGRRDNKAIISEFDHAMMDNHLSFEPEAIAREVEGLAKGDAQRARKSKIMSWAVPAAAGITTALVVKGGLTMLSGGASVAISGIGGGISAFASEYARLSMKANQIQKDNPKLTGHPKERLMQEAIKADNVKIAKDRLQKTNDKIKALEAKMKIDDELVRETLDAATGPSAKLNSLAKQSDKDKKELDLLKNKRLTQFATLKQVQFDKAEDYSITKHMMKRTMMGAVLGAGLGAVMSIEPAQTALSDAFNMASGFIAGLLAPAAEDTLVNTADAALGTDFFDQLLADGGAGLLPTEPAVDHSALVDAALAAADNQTVVAIAPEANAVIELFSANGIALLEMGDAAAALTEHFGGDVPDKFAPYVANLTSDNLAYRNEALHSIAFLLNNAGDTDMANAFMALNIMENGFNSTDPAVVRSIEGLAHYGTEASEALSAAAGSGVDFAELRAMADSAAAGDISLSVHDPANQTRFTTRLQM
jgi:hypothetical protein